MSFSALPEFYHEGNRGDQGAMFAPFGRFDSAEGQHTHFDLRELNWRRFASGL